MKHQIGRQIIELKLQKEEDAFRLQHETSTLFWAKIVPVMEQVFDKYVDKDTLVQIDKLELDLGQLSEKDLLEGHFLKDFQAQLEAILSKVHVDNPQAVETKSVAQSHFEEWLFFLEKGTLPSLAAKRSVKEHSNIEKRILDTIATQKNAKIELKHLIEKVPIALERLVLQHDENFLQLLLKNYSGQSTKELGDLFLEWKKLFKNIKKKTGKTVLKNEGKGRTWSYLFWSNLLKQLIVESKKEIWTKFAWSFLDREIETIVIMKMRDGVESKKSEYSLTRKLFKQQKRKLVTRIAVVKGKVESHDIIKTKRNTDTLKEIPSSSKVEGKTSTLEENKEMKTRLKDVAMKETEEEEERWRQSSFTEEEYQETQYIQCAGIVLIHVFLPTFFEKLGLLENRQFKSKKAAKKAVHALHYLATGELKNIAEYDLTLAKFLCGLPLNFPVERKSLITKKEAKLGNELLEAAISHWGVLGTTTPDGLRDGFLNREGKLSHPTTGWQLQIEQKTMDILLDRLPWNLNMIKLPWMPELLRVEWR